MVFLNVGWPVSASSLTCTPPASTRATASLTTYRPYTWGHRLASIRFLALRGSFLLSSQNFMISDFYKFKFQTHVIFPWIFTANTINKSSLCILFCTLEFSIFFSFLGGGGSWPITYQLLCDQDSVSLFVSDQNVVCLQNHLYVTTRVNSWWTPSSSHCSTVNNNNALCKVYTNQFTCIILKNCI